MAAYYHMSQQIIPIGAMLRGKGKPIVDPAVEDILETRRPDNLIARPEASFASETDDVSKHGLKYDSGYLHVVKLIGSTQRHDSKWVGELQTRHHPNPMMRKFCAAELAHLSDEEIADKYWAGEPSPSPNWEVAAEAIEVVSQPTAATVVRPDSMAEALKKVGAWKPSPTEPKA